MAVTFTNIIVGEGTLYVGANEGAATDVGATQEGVELAWEPDMVDIEIDQFGDAARVVQSRVKVMAKTVLAEATLENLALAWGYNKTNDITSGGGTKTLNVDIHSVYPEEHFIKIVGNAPGSDASTTKTRTYKCNRAVSYSTSSHSLKRAENTAFPVDFRILPDSAQTGKEYGTIADQT